MSKKIPCEVFHRVVGYYRPVQNFNNGKKEEFADRVFFELENSGCPTSACEETLTEVPKITA